MLLSDWLRDNDITYPEFGHRTGFSSRTIEKWARGERYPKYKATKVILRVTHGKVTPQDLYDATELYNNKTQLSAFSESALAGF